MSDNWVGPGWWMASDGKWYPPRTPVTMTSVDGDQGATRWSRRAPDSETSAKTAPLSPPQISAEPPVGETERGTPGRRAEPISVRHTRDEEPILDLSDSADVRSRPTPKTDGEVPKTGRVFSKVSAPSAVVASSKLPRPVSFAATVAAVEAFPEPQSSGDEATEMSTVVDPDDSAVPNEIIEVDESVRADEPLRDANDHPPPTPLQHAVLPALVGNGEGRRSRKGPVLLTFAVALAVLSGILGALWMQERTEVALLRAELDIALATDDVTDAGLSELNDEVRTLRLQNEQLQAQLNDMSALVLELPEGRVTEIVIPFTPVFADEENGRFIAMSAAGEYVVWAEGADGAITDSGMLSGSPTGLFAAARKAWVSTDVGRIDVVSLTNEEGLPSVEFGPSAFLAAEDRAYWTYDEQAGDLVRLRKGDGGITASVAIPVPVIDLTIGAGSVWALGEDGRVYQVNTADLTVQAIDAGTDLISITAGPDALWTLSAADGSLRRVDAVSGEVLVTVPVGRDPVDATFAGSSVWVALRSGTSLIEVDTRTSAVISRTTLPGTPTALHQGDSGVFVTMEGDVPLVRVASLTPLPGSDDEIDPDTEDANAG